MRAFTERVDDLAILDKRFHQMDRLQYSGKTYYRSKTETEDGQPLAGQLDGNRTILVGPESMLKKMLAAKSDPTPLGVKLREFGLDHDLFGVFLAEPIRSMLKEFVQSPLAQKQFPTAKTLDADLNALRVTANLDGEKLLRIILEGKNDAAAKNLEDFAEAVINVGKACIPRSSPSSRRRHPRRQRRASSR